VSSWCEFTVGLTSVRLRGAAVLPDAVSILACHAGAGGVGRRGGHGHVGNQATWVPRIMASPAYRHGLIFITFDESGSDPNAMACCGE
jgi:hypothetical protein